MNQALVEAIKAAGGSETALDYTYSATPRVFPWVFSAGGGIEHVLERLIADRPGEINCRCEYGTPLNAACWNGELGAAELIIRAGGDLTALNAAGLTPVEVAQFRGFTELVELLLRHRAGA